MDILTLALAKAMGGGASSWNDLKDKPFGEETTTVKGDTLTWDGNTDGLLSVELYDGMVTAYLVHDAVISLEDLSNGISSTVLDDRGNEYETTFNGEEIQMFAEILGFVNANKCMIALKDNTVVKDDEFTFTFPKAGVYIMVDSPDAEFPEKFVSLTIPGYNGFTTTTTELKPIETKYLPEHLHFGTETKVVEGDTLTWDGNTDGRVYVELDGGFKFVKVADIVLTLPNVANGLTETLSSGITLEVPFEHIEEAYNGGGCIGGSFFICAPTDNFNALGMTVLPESGIWFCDIPGQGYTTSLTIPNYTGFVTEQTTVKPMDEKYMPILTSPSGKKFKLSVDDSGAVTATEV